MEIWKSPQKMFSMAWLVFFSENVILTLLINFFRGLENIWGLFEKHGLCKKPTSKAGTRCLFCHLRSIALRSNRIKLKRRMKPMELECQLDKFPNESTFLNNFPSTISKIVENKSSFDLDFRNSFHGGDLECNNCNTRFSMGLFNSYRKCQFIFRRHNKHNRYCKRSK